MSEKVKLLECLSAGGFEVPPFLHLPAQRFADESLEDLDRFLKEHCPDFKVLVRSAHPMEHCFKGGTFDSLETYADRAGVIYARRKIVRQAREGRRLSIQRQQKFNGAPEIDADDMGVLVMPFVDGRNVMAKRMTSGWEFGYSGSRGARIVTDPYITMTPHDLRLLEISENIQKHLGFRCEIEYIAADDDRIWVVQAKDISRIETLESQQSERMVQLDGITRIRRRRSYRERPILVMENRDFYLDIIACCEGVVMDGQDPDAGLESVLRRIAEYEKELEDFAVRYERFAVLGLHLQVPEELFQVANHYLDDYPEHKKQLTEALRRNLYRIDEFIAEVDTLLAGNRFRRNLATHEAYGVDTVRNPLWNVWWEHGRHEAVIRQFKRLGFVTGDMVGIDVGPDEKPVVFRL